MEIQPGDRLAYALAGQAIVTLQGRKGRFTFRIARNGNAESRATHYVYVLHGPDNDHDYRFVGGITADGFYRSGKSPIGADAPSVQAFGWWWRNIESPQVTVYHAGTCGRCGRTLTTPESIRTGLGPVCVERA
jgi:hypothetical protein